MKRQIRQLSETQHRSKVLIKCRTGRKKCAVVGKK